MLHALLAALLVTPTDPIIGRASVIDGDTIEVHGQRIRLWGIDAPESGQTCTRDGGTYRCGQEAANGLSEWIAGRRVTCAARGRADRYGRIVAMCWVQHPRDRHHTGREDLGMHLVESGLALDYARFSRGEYAEVERRAREGRRGLWAGEFQRPWEWRAR